MPQVRQGNTVLNATFSVVDDAGRLALTIESRSGARGAPEARNPDYDPALELLLARLSAIGAQIADAQVYSTVALRKYPAESERRLRIPGGYPIAIALREPLELRREFARAQRIAARPPELTSSGNNNKRVRFWLEVPALSGGDAETLEAKLAGEDAVTTVSGSSSGPGRGTGAPEQRQQNVRGGRGQGYATDPVVRRAVEVHAMRVATERFESEGWQVEDTSAERPYDLRCTRDGQELHVEVKGTTGFGGQVHLTAGRG